MSGIPDDLSSRDRLVFVATHIAAQRGLSAVTYRSVAQAAGVAHNLVRHYFGTAEALRVEIMERAAAEDAAEAGLAAGSVAEFVNHLTEVLDQSPERQILQFDYMLNAWRGLMSRDEAVGVYDRYVGQVAATLQHIGLDDPDDGIAQLIFAMLDGLTLQHGVYQDEERVERMLVQLRRMLETLVAAPDRL